MAVGLTEYSVDHNRFMKTMFGPEALKIFSARWLPTMD